MQLKHFKKTFIMNNEWLKTCKALKGLLDILVCSKCHNNLYNPQQFLGCGHFSCISCSNNNSTSCNECQLPDENKDTIKDIQRIVEACTTIANEIGYKHKIKNLETSSQLSPIHNEKNSTNSNIPKIKDKQNKRKGGTYLINDHLKKTKWDKPAPTFRIPKNIDKRNPVGETRLQIECKRGNIKNVEDLLKAGADPNVTCHAGWTALQESSDFHYYEIVEILLKFKADIDKPGHEGRTALHEAVKNKDKEMVQLLLKHGAKINIRDEKNKTPIDYCGSDEIKSLLGHINEKVENTVKIPDLTENDTSISMPKSRMQNQMCAKDIVDTNGSTYIHPRDDNHVINLRRVRRHSSICQDIRKESSKKTSITDYFQKIDQLNSSEITNYSSLSRDENNILENQSSISSSSSHSRLCEKDSKKGILKRGTSENVQKASCKKTLSETLANVNNTESQQNFSYISTSKMTCNNNQTNEKNDAKSKIKSNFNTANKQSTCSNDKIGLKSKSNLKINNSDDSDIEFLFEARRDQAECSIKLTKQNDSLKNDTEYVTKFTKDCASSQESIDVVNISSVIDTEDTIIDIEN